MCRAIPITVVNLKALPTRGALTPLTLTAEKRDKSGAQ